MSRAKLQAAQSMHIAVPQSDSLTAELTDLLGAQQHYGQPSSSGGFASGFLLGQLTLALILFVFIKFFIFGEAPSADARATQRAAARRQRTLSHSKPYNTPTAPAGHARRIVQWLSGRQPVSAVKGAELVWQLGHCRFPPLRLLLGSFAVESVRDRLRSVIEEIEDWKHLSFPTGEETAKDKKGAKGDKNESDDRDGEEGDEAMDEDANADTLMREDGDEDEA